VDLTADSTPASAGIGAGPFRRVLVAWDGSADSVAALRTATAIVRDDSGHVVALSVSAPAPPREAVKDQDNELPAQVRHARDVFETTRASLARISSVRVDLRTVQGPHVAESVCDYATEHAFNLLVVGRHGDGGLRHPKLGHVAESAVRSCKIPVLLVSAS
jgi:nucleotide-binding universal stress UspA family protein